LFNPNEKENYENTRSFPEPIAHPPQLQAGARYPTPA